MQCLCGKLNDVDFRPEQTYRAVDGHFFCSNYKLENLLNCAYPNSFSQRGETLSLYFFK